MNEYEMTLYSGTQVSGEHQPVRKTTYIRGKLILVESLDPKPSLEVNNHSPDGFNWGFNGSGPAQLALALLLDVSGDPDLSARHHLAFKFAFVAAWQTSWVLSGDDIRRWLARQEITEEVGR
uniref:Uncharacterized protein n=1 Tax=viral metagenome TaxID=1070528 RepID=A0A6M3L6N7_9ZZZZ